MDKMQKVIKISFKDAPEKLRGTRPAPTIADVFEMMEQRAMAQFMSEQYRLAKPQINTQMLGKIIIMGTAGETNNNDFKDLWLFTDKEN